MPVWSMLYWIYRDRALYQEHRYTCPFIQLCSQTFIWQQHKAGDQGGVCVSESGLCCQETLFSTMEIRKASQNAQYAYSG